MEDKPTFLEETRSADVIRIEYLGDIVRLHWRDTESGELGYTDMANEVFNESIDEAREREVLRFEHKLKVYG